MTLIRNWLIFISYVLCLTACQTMHVITPHNTPNFDDEKKAECVLSADLSGAALNMAYAPNRHLLLLATGFTYYDLLNSGHYNNYADIEIGASGRLTKKINLNITAGYGRGEANWQANRFSMLAGNRISQAKFTTDAAFMHVFLNLKTDSINNNYYGLSLKAGVFNDEFRSIRYVDGAELKEIGRMVQSYELYFYAQQKIKKSFYIRGSTGVGLKVNTFFVLEKITQNTNIGLVFQF